MSYRRIFLVLVGLWMVGSLGIPSAFSTTEVWQVKEHLESIYYGCSGIYFLAPDHYLCTYGNLNLLDSGSLKLFTLDQRLLAEESGLAPIRDVACPREGVFYAFGGAGEVTMGTTMGVYRSTDGGYTWQDLTDHVLVLTETNINFYYGQAFYDVASGQEVLFVRVEGGVLKSYDSGQRWEHVWTSHPRDSKPDCPNSPLRMQFASPEKGIIATEPDTEECLSFRRFNPDLYFTEDGGASWRKIFSLQELGAQLGDDLAVTKIIWLGDTGYLLLDPSRADDLILEVSKTGTHEVLPRPAPSGVIEDIYYHPLHGLFAISGGQVFHFLEGVGWEKVYEGGTEARPYVEAFRPWFLNEYPPRLKSGYDILVMELAPPSSREECVEAGDYWCDDHCQQDPCLSDNCGNSCSEACNLGTVGYDPLQASGAIDFSGDEDFFRISVPRRGRLTIYTTGSTDTYGYLMDSSCNELARDDDSGGQGNNFKIQREVTSGIYYIRVIHFSSSGTGDYSLKVEFEEAVSSEGQPLPSQQTVGLVDPSGAPVQLEGGTLRAHFNFQGLVDILVGVMSCDFETIYWLDFQSCNFSQNFAMLSQVSQGDCAEVLLPIEAGYVLWMVAPKPISEVDFGKDPYILQFYPFGFCEI